MKGKNLSDFAGNVEREIVDFLEGALVYRLVWALESIRVRAIAVGEVSEGSFNGRTALAVETGTPNQSASLLIHAGFGSRVAAIKAVSDTNGSFSDHRGMRQWVLSDEVISLAASGNWPTPETASLWKKFCARFDSGEYSQWSAIQFKSAVIWQRPPSPGSRVLIRASRYVESPDRTPLGILKEPMRFPESGIFEARISTDCAMVEGKWIGPTTR